MAEPTHAQTSRVLLFGAEAQHAGRAAVDVPHAGPLAASALRDRVAEAVPTLRGRLDRCRVAVKHEFVSDTHTVVPGDEIALIGAVAGG
jgi:molybdopterin converting factor small subunit